MKGKGVLMRAGKRIGALCMAAVIAVMPVTSPGSLAAQREDTVCGEAAAEPEVSAAWQEQAFDGIMAEALSEELTQKLFSKPDLVIYTAEELKEFAKNSQGSDSYFEGKLVQLGADIEFGGAVENDLKIMNFSGVFDGRGHSISGIVQEVKKSRPEYEDQYLGLFYILRQGVVKNLTVKNSSFRVEAKKTSGRRASFYIGTISSVNLGEIRNCHAQGCKIICSRKEEISPRVGGITGSMESTLYGTSCSGVVAACSVTASSVEGYGFVGGIAGEIRGGAAVDCFSDADVNGKEGYAGGIAGGCYSAQDTEEGNHAEGLILNCANTGRVTIQSKGYAGGIAGGVSNVETDELSISTCRMINCYNSGDIEKKGEGECYRGGLTGFIDSTTFDMRHDQPVEIRNCYYRKTKSLNKYGFMGSSASWGYHYPVEYEVVSMSDEKLRSAEFAAQLNARAGSNGLTSWQFTGASPYPVHGAVYDVETASEHGTVEKTGWTPYRYACEGDYVFFRVNPDPSYRVTDVRAVTESGKKPENYYFDGDGGSFTMPGERVCIVVSYGSGSIADCSISLSKTEFVYNGKEKTPAVSVKDAGADLKEGTDYEVSYASNTDAGTGIVTVAGKGSYTGTAQLSFAIAKASQKITLNASSYTVTDGAKAFSIKAKASKGGEIVYSSSDQSVAAVSQKGRVTVKGPGLAVITVKAPETENYAECTRKVTVTVEPKQVKLTKLTLQPKGKLKAEWKALQNVSGYLVEYSVKKNFKDAETVAVKGSDKTSAVLKGLTAGRTYYVRVTAYKEAFRNGREKQIKGKPGEALRSGKIK